MTTIEEFLQHEWSTASGNQYGSANNPFVSIQGEGQRLSNGQRVGGGARPGMGQAPPIGTTPETPITAATLNVPPPDCGPKSQAVIDPTTGRWTCQPTSGSTGPSIFGLSITQLLLFAVLGYLGWLWWKDSGKHQFKKLTTFGSSKKRGEEEDE